MRLFSFAALVLATASAVVAKLEVKLAGRDLDQATNAEQFRRGLPPLPPQKIRSPTGMHHALTPRASPSPCTATRTITGVIEVTDKTSGQSYGYAKASAPSQTSSVVASGGTMFSITLPCAPTASDLTGLKIDYVLSTGTHSYWGGRMNPTSNTGSDLTSTSSNWVFMGNTDLTEKVPTKISGWIVESPVWTYDPTSGALTMTWYNTDGSPGTTIPVKIGSQLYAAGNISLLTGQFGTQTKLPVNYRLVQTTTVVN